MPVLAHCRWKAVKQFHFPSAQPDRIFVLVEGAKTDACASGKAWEDPAEKTRK
jgi:hypothetical protein